MKLLVDKRDCYPFSARTWIKSNCEEKFPWRWIRCQLRGELSSWLWKTQCDKQKEKGSTFWLTERDEKLQNDFVFPTNFPHSINRPEELSLYLSLTASIGIFNYSNCSRRIERLQSISASFTCRWFSSHMFTCGWRSFSWKGFDPWKRKRVEGIHANSLHFCKWVHA